MIGSGVQQGKCHSHASIVPAALGTALLLAAVPAAAEPAEFGIALFGGYYMVDGSLKLTASNGIDSVTPTGDASGNGVGFHGAGALDLTLSPTPGRDGRVPRREDRRLEVDGTTLPDYSAEWSGLMSRAGFSFYFGSR